MNLIFCSGQNKQGTYSNEKISAFYSVASAADSNRRIPSAAFGVSGNSDDGVSACTVVF